MRAAGRAEGAGAAAEGSAVGGTTWQPIVKEVGGKREVVPAQVMNLTLSADHRVIDGATGAKFLQELKSILEAPLTMLV